eukprot:scaffold188282_cov42-Prasinocladus_malaysianus.AAC.1
MSRRGPAQALPAVAFPDVMTRLSTTTQSEEPQFPDLILALRLKRNAFDARTSPQDVTEIISELFGIEHRTAARRRPSAFTSV